MKKLGAVKKTAREFEIVTFQDYDRNNCSLQASSLAIYQQPGTSAVWLGIAGNRMHLSHKQVQALLNHLAQWLEHGSFKGKKS